MPEAQSALGGIYLNGPVPRNFSEAARWYRKAAEQGWQYAQFFLAFQYRYGMGVPRDLNQAMFWCRKAAEQGNELAKEFLMVLSHGSVPEAQ
jgi:TPR repeat protein